MKILKAIIQNYLETGEPVGSRTISKYSDLKLSSATIRNEMSDLEELGYIIQPHTSAGRIPSDAGYRLYVDELMKSKDREVTEMKEFMIQKVDKMEMLLKQVAKILASNTNYATMITSPRFNQNKLKFIQLSQMDAAHILAVIVVDGNIVKNRIINTDGELDNETMLKLNMLLNTCLNGLTLEDINLGIISKLKFQAGEHGEIVEHVLDAVAEAIHIDEDLEIYTSGATNIFKYPELSSGGTASELISALEEKQQLIDFVTDTVSDEDSHGIQVYIGNETSVRTMKDCSVVTATYELEEGVQGTIGIIGPKRMDYEHVVNTLKTLKAQLDAIYKKT
ncbi:heat-inducible transcriptional repressor HrcA [Anaerobium acetethylicum]|nr:heat-inducible transcriptional repressor HrcA [Anaerobium acetethylicum]